MAEPTVGGTKFTEELHPQPDENAPVRQSTLIKNSVKRKSTVEPGTESYNSFLYSPIPTSSNPTDALVNRFQGKLALPLYFGKGSNKFSFSMETSAQGLHYILP